MSEHHALQDALETLYAVKRSAVSDTPPVVAVVGAFSRGKSALVNALIQAPMPLLPVHPLPTTAVPTRIAYSNIPQARLLYSDNESRTITVEDTRTITAYRGAIDGLREIQIGWPCALLKSGLVLLDTPGIDVQEALTLQTGEGVGIRADDVAALLFVFAADPPLGDAELDFLHEIAASVPQMLLVQTKCDALAEQALQQATAFNRTAIDATWPALTNTPIHSVSVLSGAGLAALRTTLAKLDVDKLRRERDIWRLEAAHTRARILQDAFQIRYHELAKRNAAFQTARDACVADLDTVRAGALATLAQLSEYTLGNLSATMYQIDPTALSGARGLLLANTELRHIRDQLANEIERALSLSRRRLLDSLTANGLPTGTIPELPTISLPDPQMRTVAVRITERRVFRPKQVDAKQTINAYRTAVARMADAYAAELLSALESFFSEYQITLTRSLSQGPNGS